MGLCLAAFASAAQPEAFEQVALLWSRGEGEAAYPLLARLAKAPKPREEVFLYKGAHERKRGDLVAAQATFGRGFALHPRSLPLGLELAVTLSWAGDLPSALAAYEDVLLIDPGCKAALVGKARVLGWMSRAREARQILQGQLARAPEDLEVLLALADLERAQYRRRVARELYERVLGLEAGQPEALAGLRKLRELEQLEVSLESSRLIVDGGAFPAVAGFSIRYRPRPAWQLFAQRSLEVRGLQRPGWEQLGEGRGDWLMAGAALEVRPGWHLSVSGQEARRSEGTVRSVAVEVARRRPSGTSWRMGIKPGTGGSQGDDLLVWLGWVRSAGRSGEVSVQTFHYSDSAGGASTSLVLRSTLPLRRRAFLTTAASLGMDRERSFYSWTLEPSLRVSPRVSLALRFHGAQGLSRQRLLGLGLRISN